MKPLLRPSGRKGGFDGDALARLALVVKTASLGQRRVTAAVIRTALGWGRTVVYAALREAVARGLVERVGLTKGTWYRVAS